MSATSDPQDELFDVLDDAGRPTGRTKRRRDVHRDGDWHGAVHVWVVTLASGAPELVLQRRSRTKDTWPGRLDVAVGGHVRAGETVVETLREAEEEIGLTLSALDVTRLGTRYTRTVTDTGRLDNEVQHVFGAVVDLPVGGFRPHPEEVEDIIAVPLARAAPLLSGREMLPADDGYYVRALCAVSALAEARSFEPFEIRPEASGA